MEELALGANHLTRTCQEAWMDEDGDVEVNEGRGGQERRPGDVELIVGVSASAEKKKGKWRR
jgi:hypothetical protein